MKFLKSLFLIFCLLVPCFLKAEEVSPPTASAPQNEPAANKIYSNPINNFIKNFASASEPSRFFFAPTSSILKSLEVMITTGGFFGVEEDKVLFSQLTVGLGNIAEVEFSTSNISNRLTGEASAIPTSVFKVALIPQRFTQHWYIPQMALQLRSTSWRPLAKESSQLLSENQASYDNQRLNHLRVNSRFTTLYYVVGKDFPFGGFHCGVSLSDIRTQSGHQVLYDEALYSYIPITIPELKKQILAPFGGLYFRATEDTWLMAEVEPIPRYGYDVKSRIVSIQQAWLGIGGIRFYIGKWLSLDTGVKYQSDFDGIADAEINIGFNLLMPLKK